MPASNAAVIGNVLTANSHFGILAVDAVTVVGNAIRGSDSGIEADFFTGVVERNNVFANRTCGLKNYALPSLPAANNYWGQRRGPARTPQTRSAT